MKKILFLTLNTTSNRTPEENLGIYYLQEALYKQGIQSEYIDCWLEGKDHLQLADEINDKEYLFVGISGCLSNVEEIRKLAPHLTNHHIVCGGYGATFGYKDLLKAGIEIVILGEGDKTIIDLADYYMGNMDLRNVENIAYLSSCEDQGNEIILQHGKEIINLDELPLLKSRKYLDYIKSRKASINILGSKGCMGNCNFCSINQFYSFSHRKWRGRCSDAIVEEMLFLYKQGIRVFKFVDDSFIENERDTIWCQRFAEKIKESGMDDILFRISIRANKVSMRIIDILSSVGLFAVSCGIENFSDSMLERIGKRTNSVINQCALDIFKQKGIYVQAGFILFDDLTTMSELRTNLIYLKKNMWIVMKGIFSEIFAAEGTAYSNYLLKSGKITGKKYGNYTYSISDSKASIVYSYLKRWHLLQEEFYDKLIDPISAPKALTPLQYKMFFELYLQVHQNDVAFFEQVLDCVETGDSMLKCDQMILLRKESLNKDFDKVNHLYDLVGLEYSAKYNIFWRK
ncbi:B12-binding domain-containing radical SAM protein [Ihubacter sp. rT4E-8]|uniref:B12-binding domain-containing radical SAM protein n=1 Tax=Ihubacter sp. rT4E-8 TaxID=3242369 RepID=UPI003CE8C512